MSGVELTLSSMRERTDWPAGVLYLVEIRNLSGPSQSPHVFVCIWFVTLGDAQFLLHVFISFIDHGKVDTSHL